MKEKIKTMFAMCLIVAFFLVCMYPPILHLQKATAEITAATETVAAQIVTDQGGWQVTGTFLAAGDEATDLGVAERTLSTIRAAVNVAASGDGKIVIYGPLNAGANAIRLRNIGLAAAGDHVYHIYTASKGNNDDCVFVKRGTLTFKTGSQASTTALYEYADLLTVTNTSASSSAWTVANPGDGSELVAEAFIDLQGDDMIVIVPTTLDDNSKLLGKFY